MAKNELIAIKEEIKKLEMNNFSSVFVFSSGFPWFKSGFNSALIYEYQIAPHVSDGTKFKLHVDDDHYARSRVGIISIGNILEFARIMALAGAVIPDSLKKYFREDGKLLDKRKKIQEKDIEKYYEFVIPSMTKAKIQAFIDAKNSEDDELNRLVMPYYIPQELYADLRRLAVVSTDLARALPNGIRDIYCFELVKLPILSIRDVNLTCNGFSYSGGLTFGKALINTIYRCAELEEMTRVLMDTRSITHKAGILLLKLALKVQKDARDEGKRLKDSKDGSKIKKTIEKAQGFPRLDDFNPESEPYDIADGLEYF